MNKANYGIDAPGVVRGLSIAGGLGIISGTILAIWPNTPMAFLLQYWGFWSGGSCLATACVMIWSSMFGKFLVRDRIIAAIPWRGDEKVLDVGCGHGLMLIAAAKRLTSGKVTGIDIWQSKDQYGNSPEATLANAKIEGVFDRVEIKNADARQMPFQDESFDVILSSLALHNIPDKEGRRKAMLEMARVLKPGGRLAILDIMCTGEYVATLRQAGIGKITRSWPFPLFLLPTRIVTTMKSNGSMQEIPASDERRATTTA